MTFRARSVNRSYICLSRYPSLSATAPTGGRVLEQSDPNGEDPRYCVLLSEQPVLGEGAHAGQAGRDTGELVAVQTTKVGEPHRQVGIAMQRIALRDRPYERNMAKDYIGDLNQAYEDYFAAFESPLLKIETSHLDFVANRDTPGDRHRNLILKRCDSR